MTLFARKRLPFKAVQWFKGGDHPAVVRLTPEVAADLPEWLQDTLADLPVDQEYWVLVPHPHSCALVNPGDWIAEREGSPHLLRVIKADVMSEYYEVMQ